MGSFQVVARKVAKVATLTTEISCHAFGNLVSKPGLLSFEELSRRLTGAVRALEGEELRGLSPKKTHLQTAEEIVRSYSFCQIKGISKFIIPADVTDIDAMKMLNEYFRRNQPTFNRDAVYERQLDWLERVHNQFQGYCQERSSSSDRQFAIVAVVAGTEGEDRTVQESVLKRAGLVFSDPRDQVLAAVIHACKHQGADLFQALWVRGSVRGYAPGTDARNGVTFIIDHDERGRLLVAASGSPSL